jgi:GH15 family glucan-1,4-alpha-glucosidase
MATVFTNGTVALSVHPSLPLAMDLGEDGELTLRPGQHLTVAVSGVSGEPLVQVPPDRAWQLLLDDAARWQQWTSRIPSDLPFAEAARRSALTLRLLTHSPTGAPVAAVTTSLPEVVGGERNWDYRYTWPRDASIGVAAFVGLGMQDEARMFLRWLLHASRLDRPRLPVLLTLDGCRAPRERLVAGWPGYRASRPVRTGNGARDQHQLDGYGWVVDAAYVYDSCCAPIDSETWRAVAAFADFSAERWRLPDAGIWEERGEPSHHTHSKLMAWLALDRALSLARGHRVRGGRVRRWEAARDAIALAVRGRGFNDAVGSYTRTLGGLDLDAAVLVLPVLGIEPADSPRLRSTIEAVRQRLTAGGPLLYRYPPGSDGLPGLEGAFLPCSFWLVQALAITGRASEAVDLMHQLTALSPLGLFSEEVDPNTGDMVGNYPQALTHAALLQAVLALRDVGVSAP